MHLPNAAFNIQNHSRPLNAAVNYTKMSRTFKQMETRCAPRTPTVCNYFCFIVSTVIVGLAVYYNVNLNIQSHQKLENLAHNYQYLTAKINRIASLLGQKDGVEPPQQPSTVHIQQSNQLLRDLRETKELVESIQRKLSTERKESPLYDKTGRTDFALESLGGRIISVKSKKISEANFFSALFGHFFMLNNARLMIQASSQPGECFSFEGSQAVVVIKLMGKILIDSICVEHIPMEISPSKIVDSAPKEFAVYGMQTPEDLKPVELGEFVFEQPEMRTLQTFHLSKARDQAFQHIRFDFRSNHGNPRYTCIYRLRVHGSLEQ